MKRNYFMTKKKIYTTKKKSRQGWLANAMQQYIILNKKT